MHETLGIGSRLQHPEFGVGVVIQVRSTDYVITFVNHGVKKIARNYEEFEVLEAYEPDDDLISLKEVAKQLERILGRFADIQEVVDLGDKWAGGMLVFKPANPDMKSYEMPINTFFHKIVMVRDRLRVMEQRINSSKMTDEEKINLQQYISRIYGSLTSFNIFFKDQSQKFVGAK